MSTIYARIHTLMKDEKPRSFTEIAKEVGCCVDSASKAIKQLREDKRPIFILKWTQKPTGTIYAKYQYGDGVDAPRPPAMSRAQRKALAKARASTEQHFRAEARAKLAAIQPFRDPFTSAFFGEHRAQSSNAIA